MGCDRWVEVALFLASTAMWLACGEPRPALTPAPSVAPAPKVSDGVTPGVDSAHWASATSSPINQRTMVGVLEAASDAHRDQRCMATAGCPFPPLSIPPCPQGLAPITTQEVLVRAEKLQGHAVAVRGTLEVRNRKVSLLDCQNRCCNRSDGIMAIAAEPVIGFLVDENPLAFHCVGDESVLCCGFPQNTEVIAFGTIVVSHLANRPIGVAIRNPLLCIPPYQPSSGS